MTIQKRRKASEVFEASPNPFLRKSSFEDAFPNVEDILIEVQQGKYGANDQWRQYTRDNFPGEFVDCSNALCYNGGLQIGSVIRDMLEERKEHVEDSRLCQGDEGSPKGRRRYGPCPHLFEYKIRVNYRNA